MPRRELEQGTPDWLAWRAEGLGGSDIAAVLGVSPWMTARQLYRAKRGEWAPIVTPAMQRGTVLEAEGRAAYSIATGHEMRPTCWEYETWPVLRASLDGVNHDGSRLLEVKCPTSGGVRRELPEHYHAQVQQQLLVTGAAVCDVWYYHGEGEGRLVASVEPTREWAERITEAARTFWDALANGVEPEPSERDRTAREDEKWLMAASEFLHADAIVGEWEGRRDAAREVLIKLAGDVARSEGGGVLATRYSAKGGVDYAKVPQLKGVDLEPYRKPGRESWRIGRAGGE